MTDVSTPALTVAAAACGVPAVIPSHNVAADRLAETLTAIGAGVGDASAPWGVNLVVHRTNQRRDHDVACIAGQGVPFVVASVGSPAPVVAPLHAAGVRVFADVASMRHVERALEVGVDGLVALCAGAGGQTGSLNPFAFVRAIREAYDGFVAVAGGIADGVGVRAACALGADVAYLGTRFIAAAESGADDAYRAALIAAGPDDVVIDTSMTGLPANVLRGERPAAPTPGGFDQAALLAHRGAWSSGHGVDGVREVMPCAAVVAALEAEYQPRTT